MNEPNAGDYQVQVRMATTMCMLKLRAFVQDLGGKDWHGLNAAHVWSLWTRYACTAFYAHPSAWNEIGFPGPAYPRGYKHAGVDAREPFEVADAHPVSDPARDLATEPASGKDSA